jgi:hypothetical protein
MTMTSDGYRVPSLTRGIYYPDHRSRQPKARHDETVVATSAMAMSANAAVHNELSVKGYT